MLSYLIWIKSSQQYRSNTENHDYINYVLCQLCAVFMSIHVLIFYIIIMSHFLGVYQRIIGFIIRFYLIIKSVVSPCNQS